MFKLVTKLYTILSHPGRYVSNRPYTRNNENYQTMGYNAFRNRNGGVYTSCKSVEPIKTCKYIEKLFICEITNKPKRKGSKDCKCEKTCIVNKSETQIIHESSTNDK